jgi:glycerate 2-kinase
MDNRKTALEIFLAGVESVKPDHLIRNTITYTNDQLKIKDLIFDLSEIRNIYVIGAGKASAMMASELESVLGSGITAGHIITKYKHAVPLQTIEVSEAGHPVPDENGLKSTQKLISIAQKAGSDDLVICLLSGGGSSLLTDLPENCTLDELSALNNLLLKSGADIQEINCVRKHLSKIKGGQLVKIAAPAKIISFILSDVIGDPIDVIASGPTAVDESTFNDALNILKKYRLTSEAAPSILRVLEDGSQGKRPETLKSADVCENQFSNIILGNNELALQASKSMAQKMGFLTAIETNVLSGNAEDIAGFIVEKAVKAKKGSKICWLYGGEPTVKISGNGLGGRNQHLALICAKLLQNEPGITILSGGTDGTDGPTDAAGAIVDSATSENAKRLNLDMDHFLHHFDSYHFFEKEGGLIITGPTQTNVMDIIVVLIG